MSTRKYPYEQKVFFNRMTFIGPLTLTYDLMFGSIEKKTVPEIREILHLTFVAE